MIIAQSYKGQTVAVVGLGRTGITAAKSLKKGGAKVLAWDDMQAGRDAAKAAGLILTDLEKTDWSVIDSLVLSPGIAHIKPDPHWTAQRANEHGIPIICDIEIFAKEIAARAPERRPVIIAITGTNGKSTTTSLIGHILNSCGRDAQIGGNIGRGVLDLEAMHSGTHYVLELSSYQLERTNSLRANSAVFINLTPDHIERHGNMAGYRAAKLRIFDNQQANDIAVIGVDDENGQHIATDLIAKNGRRIIPISGSRALGRGVSVINGKLYASIERKSVEICDLRQARALDGQHNWQNAAAAFAAVQGLGLDPVQVGKAILSFGGLAHRMERLGKVLSVSYVNDSKATNAEAAKQALRAYRNIYWIAGGVAKEGGIAPLATELSGVRKAYLIGEAALAFRSVLKKQKIAHKISGELRNAILCATRDALSDGHDDPVILLSPACASFDQFKNFEIRGDAFRREVQVIIDMFEAEKSKGYAA